MVEHTVIGTPFTISHYYPKKFEGFAIRNRDLFTIILKCPYDHKGEIWKLYQTLTFITVLDKGRFSVIVSIPVLDNINTFEIFNIFNMPVPVKDHVVATDKLHGMVAWYRL